MKRNLFRLTFLPAIFNKAKLALFGRPVLRIARPVRFMAANGEQVMKVITGSGATGFLAVPVPVEAFSDWIRRLDAHATENRQEIRRILDQADATGYRRRA